MSLSIIGYAILFYVLYKFVTKIVIPVGKTFLLLRTQVKNIKQQFQPKNDQTESDMQSEPQQSITKKAKPLKVKADYIDFEEVKK